MTNTGDDRSARPTARTWQIALLAGALWVLGASVSLAHWLASDDRRPAGFGAFLLGTVLPGTFGALVGTAVVWWVSNRRRRAGRDA